MDENRNENDLIQYYIVNEELNMSTGKIGVQCCHGAIEVALRDQNNENFKSWKKDYDEKKIFLSGKLKDIYKVKEKIPDSYLVVDKGYTEIEPNSETALVLPIMTRKEAKKIVGRLRLLK